MNGEVQLIVGGSKFLVTANAQSSGLAGCLGIRVFQDITSYLGNELVYVDAIYGTVKQPYSVFTPWNGTFMILELTASCIPYTFSANGTVDIYQNTSTYLDLYENESISQNWAFTDIGKFTTQAPFTRNFRIPLTKNNQDALGALADTNISAGVETWFNYKLEAELRVDTVPIATGYLRVIKAYKQKDRLTDLDVTFYASVADFSKDVNEKKLSDLDWSDINGLVNYANASALASGAFDYMFALIDRGQLFNQTNGRSLINDVVYAGDLTPCVKWSSIFDRIFEGVGWSYDATEVINTIGEWWMPFCNTAALKFGTSLVPNNFFLAYLNTDITLSANQNSILQPTTEGTDNGANYTPGATSTYQVPLHGTYNFNYWVTVTILANASAPFLTGAVQIAIENVTQGTSALIVSSQLPNPDVASTYTISGITADIVCNQNDVLRLRITYVNTNGAAATQIRIESGASQTSGTGWSLAAIPSAFYGYNLNLALNAPDMRQIDFITDVIKMMNCAVIPDPVVPKRLIIQPMNTFIGSGAISDWTPYLDIDQDIVISTTTDYQKNKLKFTYSKGADSASKAYDQAKRIFGDYVIDGFTINNDTPPNEFTTGEQTVQLVTQSSPLLPTNNCEPLLKFLDDSGTFVVPGPRCVYLAGTQRIVKMYYDSFNQIVEFECPIVSHYSDISPTVTDYDLNWAPEVPLYSIPSNPYANLYTQYWMNYLNSLYSPDARIMEASFALPFTEVVNIDFTKKIWIKDSYWRLLSVNDYKVGENVSTVCKLIKLLTAKPDCEGRPSLQEDSGEVIFVNIDDEVIPSTEACCTRYGYSWDSINSKCWGQVAARPITNSVTPNRIKPEFKKAVVTRSEGVTDEMVVTGDEITTDPSNINSIIGGEKITLDDFNQNTLAVGENLYLTKSVQGSSLLGKNVYTNLPGIHVGGGYRGGNIATSAYTGWAQFGQFVLQRQFTVATSGTTFDLYIEGVTGEYINIPDETVWSVIMNVNITDGLGASETSLHHFTLDKYAGLTNASAITTLNTIGAIGTNVFAFGIDTATNTHEHRINVTVSGGSYPEGFIVAASIQYQQVKTST